MPAREPAPSLLARLIEALLRRRRVAGLVLALVVVVAALGALRLRVDFSSTGFYGDDSALARGLAEHQARWGVDDAVLLVLLRAKGSGEGAEESGHSSEPGVLTRERLAAIAGLGDQLAAREEVVSVRSIATLELPLPGDGGEVLGFPAFVEAAGLDLRSSEGARARARVLPELPVVPSLLAHDAASTVLAVELAFSSDDVLRTRLALAQLEHELERADPQLAAVGLERALAGIPAIRAGFVDLVIHDQLILVPLSLALMALCLWLLFRRLHGVLIPALAAGVPTLMLVGLMGWSGEAVGLLNQTYFTLLPVIAVADAIHMLARYHEARAALGPGREAQHQAIVTAGSRVGLACLLTSLTTAAGFASLGLARMPILRGFGLYAGLGVGLAFVVVVVLVPLLLSLLDPDAPARTLPGAGLVEGIVELALRRPRAVLAASALLIALSLIPASQVVVDNQLSGLLDAEHPSSLASAQVDAELGGVLGLELELSAPAGVDLRDPAVLEVTLGFERWLAAREEVRDVRGLASALDELSAATGTEHEELPARMQALSRFVPLARFVSEDGVHMNIHAGVPDIGGVAFVALAEAAEAELRARLDASDFPGASGVRVQATGTALVAYRGVNGITRDLRRSFVLVFAVVLVIIIALFRSLWPALIALIPNGAPLLLGYACVGLAGFVLDPLAAVILTLALGIAVDDTLHIMVRTREERAAGASVEEALRRALSHSGRAVAVTTAVVVAGLGLNLLASFPPLRLLGLLGAAVLIFALLLDLLVLPALIVLLRGRGL